jgi:hypothetical protein
MADSPLQQAVGNQLRTLLTRAAAHPEALAELAAMMPTLENPSAEAPRMLRGFELTANVRNVATGGTRYGDSSKAMAKEILGAQSDTAPGVSDLAAKIASVDRALKGDTGGFERLVRELQVPAKIAGGVRSLLRNKGSFEEVMDGIEELLARSSLTDNERAKLLELRDYFAAQRLLRALAVAKRMRGKPKDIVQAASCLTKAAALTSSGAILGAKAALAAITTLLLASGEATAQEVSEVLNDIANFTPAQTLTGPPRSAVATALPPAGTAVGSRERHGARP